MPVMPFVLLHFFFSLSPRTYFLCCTSAFYQWRIRVQYLQHATSLQNGLVAHTDVQNRAVWCLPSLSSFHMKQLLFPWDPHVSVRAKWTFHIIKGRKMLFQYSFTNSRQWVCFSFYLQHWKCLLQVTGANHILHFLTSGEAITKTPIEKNGTEYLPARKKKKPQPLWARRASGVNCRACEVHS